MKLENPARGRRRTHPLALLSLLVGVAYPVLAIFASGYPNQLPYRVMIGLDGNLFPYALALVLPVLGIGLALLTMRAMKHSHRRFRGKGLAGVGFWVSVLLIVALTFYQFNAPGSGFATPRSTCLSNLRQVAEATAIYAHEHEDVLPPSLAKLAQKDSNRDAYACPENKTALSSGYGMNRALYGRDFGTVRDPVHIVLVADCRNAQGVLATGEDIDRSRHGAFLRGGQHWEVVEHRGFNAAFVDGHAEALPAAATVKFTP